MIINSGPLKAILNPSEFFLNNNSLIEYSLREDTIIMSMKFIDDNGNDLSIKLEMFFNKNPIFLKGWEVIDYQNKRLEKRFKFRRACGNYHSLW